MYSAPSGGNTCSNASFQIHLTSWRRFEIRYEESALVLDEVPHVVVQAAVGEGHKGAAVEEDNPGALVGPPLPSDAGGSARHTSDEKDSLADELFRDSPHASRLPGSDQKGVSRQGLRTHVHEAETSERFKDSFDRPFPAAVAGDAARHRPQHGFV